MKNGFLNLLLLAFFEMANGQTNKFGGLKGTLIIGVIASDGIVIAVDSRLGIVGDNNGNLAAFMDGTCKLTLLNNFPVAFAGNSLIGNNLIYNLIDDFNKQYSDNNDIQQTFIDFEKYIKSFPYPLEAKFIGGGYYNNVPYLFAFNSETHSAMGAGFLFSEPDLIPYLQQYVNLTKTCEEYKPILESIIYQYAKDKGKENLIGGPISVAKITPGNKVIWMQHNFLKNKQKDYRTFLNNIVTGSIKLTPVVPNGINLAIDAMKARLNILR